MQIGTFFKILLQCRRLVGKNLHFQQAFMQVWSKLKTELREFCLKAEYNFEMTMHSATAALNPSFSHNHK